MISLGSGNSDFSSVSHLRWGGGGGQVGLGEIIPFSGSQFFQQAEDEVALNDSFFISKILSV